MQFTYMSNLWKLEFPKRMLQRCPLCGEDQPAYIRGTVRDLEDHNEQHVSHDRGYSFCNCNNIFFTKWSNMDQEVYDEEYADKYKNNRMDVLMQSYANDYFGYFDGNIKTFLEIGSIHDFLLEQASKRKWDATGLDIINHKDSEYNRITGDFENSATQKKLGKYDVIWASHVFEHFKNPVHCACVCYDLLNRGGYIFIAMPDPFFIDWSDPYSWNHGHVKEHHIMWDMNSFIKVMEDIGFTKVLANRNIDPKYVCTGDYHLIFKKD